MSLFSDFDLNTTLYIYSCAHECLGENRLLFGHPVAAGELIALPLCVGAGFWRLLSLQASRRGEESFVWPQEDAHQTAKRTTGKTVVSTRTAYCSTSCWQQKAKRQIGLHIESGYITREKGCRNR